jgi:hypothetical protein
LPKAFEIKLKPKRRHFYFAEKGTFQFWVDSVTHPDLPAPNPIDGQEATIAP